MSWTALYLRAGTEAEMMIALEAAGLVHIDGDAAVIAGRSHTRIAVLGVLTHDTGVMLDDGEGGEYAQQEPTPGWHVNVLTCSDEVIAALESVTIAPEPDTPSVIWQQIS